MWAKGACVRAYDPQASDETRRIYPNEKNLVVCESSGEALEGADGLAVMTEWQEFRSPDFANIRRSLSNAVIFDGRNLYDPATMTSLGFTHYAVGRGTHVGTDTE